MKISICQNESFNLFVGDRVMPTSAATIDGDGISLNYNCSSFYLTRDVKTLLIALTYIALCKQSLTLCKLLLYLHTTFIACYLKSLSLQLVYSIKVTIEITLDTQVLDKVN